MEPHSLFINHGKLWIGAKIQMNIFQIFHSADEMMSRQRDRKTCVLYSLLVMMGIRVGTKSQIWLQIREKMYFRVLITVY